MGETSREDLVAPEGEATPPARRLAEGYYVDNFLLLLEQVLERYEDLLAAPETDFIDRFRNLTSAAQRLYVRLVMRKGPLFRRDLLSYSEIPDLDAARRELEAAAFADAGEDASLQELLALLRRDELVGLLADLGLEIAGGRRQQLLDVLLAGETAPIPVIESALRNRLDVLRPLGIEILWLLKLLFFGNLNQDWREFMLRDLEVQRYEDYSLGRQRRIFPHRQAALDTLELRVARLQVRELLQRPVSDAALAAAVEMAKEVAKERESWDSMAWRHGERILAKVGRELERASRFEESLRIYGAADGPPTRERRCRVLAGLGRDTEALDLCEQIAEDPLDVEEAAFAPFFAHRLKRKLGLTAEPWRRPQRPVEVLEVESTVLEAPRPDAEWLALALLAEQGRRGVYGENWLWRSLFGLAFWDVIFVPLPGVFAHPFQLGPLDLREAEFFHRRKAMIEERLEALREEKDLASRLEEIYRCKHGVANAFVAWQPQLEETLRFAWTEVSGAVLAIFCERLARDPGRHGRGLPDLLVLSPESTVGVELLEVKAPGDQLRPEQGAWIDYLNSRGVPAKILRLVGS